MFYEVALSPSGKLRCVSYEEAASAAAALPDKLIKPIVKALSADVAKALFLLAACPQENGLSPSFVFWRQLACIYLTERCHTTVSTDTELEAIEPLPALADLLKGAPPMPGAEYLSLAVLQHYWCLLDHWLCEQVKQQGKGLTAFLSLHAKQWHAAGKVCFHLVENKKDPAYPFAFMATYAAQDSTRHQALGKALQEYAGAANKKALINLLSPVHLASKSSTLIAELVASGDIYHPLAWTPQQAYEFMQDVPLYEDCGVVVRLPDWWKKRARPQVGVRLETAAKNTLGASSLLNFRVELALGEQTLSEQEWQDLMDADDGLLLLKGQWVEVDREQLAQALAHWQSVEKQQGQDGMSFVEGMRLLAGASADLSTQSRVQDSPQWSFVRADKNLSQILQQLREPESLPATVAGKSLLATLRPYQEVGLNWLWRLSQLGLGACLADDMGLGKTLQIIALLLKYKRKRDVKPSLLVLPASLLGNWQQEMDKFAPSLRYLFVHPAMNDKTTWQAMSQGELPTAIDKLDVVLTTYGMLSRQDWLMEQDWQLVVLDEAQAIKNPGSRQSKAVKQLKAQARIALTGTPVENRLSDLWSLFDFLCPGLLGNAGRFKQFTKQMEAREHEQYAPLRQLVQPYILRRLKTDKRVIADLPDKTEVNAWCYLAKEQAALYEKMVLELKQALQANESEENDAIKRRGLVLAYLMRFKQICNHPSQLLGDGDYQPGHSGKFERLGQICEEIASRQEKVLVFTQFREMCEPLAAFLAEFFGRPGLILHGGTSVKQRQNRVQQFQAEDGPPFFVLSIKAGGTGLNLTAASHVIHFDRWWNPAVENQATDRAFRIGQKRNVMVHKFVCQGTVEERIDALIGEKSALASELLEGGGSESSLLTEMDDSALINLVSLDVNKINA